MSDFLVPILLIAAAIIVIVGMVTGLLATLAALYYLCRRRLLRQCWRWLLTAWSTIFSSVAMLLFVDLQNGGIIRFGVLSNDAFALVNLCLLTAGCFCFLPACLAFNCEVNPAAPRPVREGVL